MRNDLIALAERRRQAGVIYRSLARSARKDWKQIGLAAREIVDANACLRAHAQGETK